MLLGSIVGSTIGGRSGQTIAMVVSALAGSMIGSTVEEKASQVSSLEMVIHKDGKEIVVVQKKESGFIPGKPLRVVGSNVCLNVSLL